MVEGWLTTSKSMSGLFGKSLISKQKGNGESINLNENNDDVKNNIVNLGDFSNNDNYLESRKELKGELDRSKGSLLRLFQSDVFDAHLHLYYIYHHKEFGVHEYLVNLLYERSDEILWYLPQLCEISLNRFEKSSLWKYFLDKSSENMNFSLIISWMYQAMSEDNIPLVSEYAQNMLQEIEMAMVNSKLKPDIRYIEKRLYFWRRSKSCLFHSLSSQNIKLDNNQEDIESQYSDSEMMNRENTKTQLSLAIYSTLPSSETINLNADEDYNKEDNMISSQTDSSIQLGLEYNTIQSSSKTIRLSSCDVLPDIWIYRIINDDFSCENKEKIEYIRTKLSLINRQFKNLYSNATCAAYYNPNPGTSYYINGVSSNTFGSLNQGFLPTNIITGSSSFGTFSSSGNSSKISIPYFFFSKLGSPFDLIDVNKIINDIQLRSKSRINHINKSYNFNTKEFNSENNSSPMTPKDVIRITHPFSPSESSDLDDDKDNCDDSVTFEEIKLIPDVICDDESNDNKVIPILTPNSANIVKSLDNLSNENSSSPIQINDNILNNEEIFKVYISEIEKESETLYYLLKQHRYNYFNRVNQLVSQFLEISNYLQSNINKEHRCEILEFIIEELNLWLFYSRFSISISRTTFLLNSISLPMASFNNEFCSRFSENDSNLNQKNNNTKGIIGFSHSNYIMDKGLCSLNNCQFLRIIPNECKIYNSRKRVHFLLAIEIADLDDLDYELGKKSQELISKDILNYLKNHGIKLKTGGNENDFDDNKNTSQDILLNFLNILSIGISESIDMGLSQEDFNQVFFIDNKDSENIEDCDDIHENNNNESSDDEVFNENWPQETWSSKIKRYRKDSPYSKLKSWGIKTLLLKSSDDLRQEYLASQLLQQFDWIFKINKLPLWLHPYEILVIGSHGGFIEYIQDTFSIDSLKRKFQTDNLLNCFDQLFKDDELKSKARKCFVESHAAYSLVSFFLQVKDRHNGNFLIDKHGHIIQIDYGFMLSNSPGNVNFEQSPFKLTQEFLDVMMGENSSDFQYFQQLIIKGFLASRKHVDQIVLTIESMTSASKLPCFSLFTNKEYFVQEIRDRFFLHLTEEQCVIKVTELIQSSINNWRSIQYDAFQRITNGIL
ncbi:phosphatidylinositol 4-kinase [Cryptosporidium ubiquitum]|uniref:1-phosphatidylinositol 4-kinase n=1 Tax=Cryptosporidium ubiquitum TaxID=857276 RepID=A0A1J4MIX4_9CRYT|nr:phosphatidylinositol 4-kinase [Cryptosporidium ubiquitum]OII72805.1 phosphatidylinositol 4-kinase [Cryptosporidium ubiquitum]